MPEVVEDITLQHTAMTGAAQSQVRNRRELEETIGALQKVQKAHSMATELKEKATQATSPAERERLLSEAFEKETEAHGHSKMARRMQSGTWQGLFGGGGIGVGVGMGLGAILGTLLGGLLTIPTTVVGGLTGSVVGAIHGPWISVGGIQKRWEDASPGEVVDAIEREQKPADGMVSEGREQLPQPRKKPRKIEIRSQQVGAPIQSEETG